MRPGVPRSLVTMPGVVGPCSSTQYLTRSSTTNDRIQQGHLVSQSIDTILTNNAQQAHSATVLESTWTGTTHRFNNLRLVAFVFQALSTTLTTVRFRYSNVTLGQVSEGLIPGHTNEFVGAPACHLIFFSVLFIKIRKTIIRPLLPTYSNHRILVSVRSVSSSRIRHSAQTHAWVPRGICLVTV